MHVGVAPHKGAACVGVAAAVGHGFQSALCGLCSEDVVVGIDEGGAPFGGQVAVQLCLGPYNTLEAAETFEVCAAHVGYEAEVGVGNVAEVGYLARMACPHLYDGNLCIGRDGEEGERHPEVVVVIARSGVGAVSFGQYGMHQLLGGGLPIGAGNAYKGDA